MMAFPTHAELRRTFGEQVQGMHGGYVCTAGPDVRGIVEVLRRDWEARIVTVFAEDRRADDGVFFNYYVFEQRGNPDYLILRAPVRPDDLEFPSLSAELPALNWQEREIQDWFGL
jgi:Ni,Fe-hydrogenase III component G